MGEGMSTTYGRTDEPIYLLHKGELRLERRDGHVWLIDAQGRETGFPLVQPGHSAFSDVEQKYLACTAEGRYVLYDLNELYFDFGTMPAGDGD
jgi:hypothetical protein